MQTVPSARFTARSALSRNNPRRKAVTEPFITGGLLNAKEPLQRNGGANLCRRFYTSNEERMIPLIHSFLLIGQSNMAGRGFVHEVEHIQNPHIKVLRNGRWQPMYVPVNCDRLFSGINLAESFADCYQKEHGVDVGLIPCADGGTTISQWKKGSLLYDHALYQAELAQRTSTLCGVLWHQGESDCEKTLYPLYKERFRAFLTDLIQDLNLNDVPFLAGGLGDFLAHCPLNASLANYTIINQAIKQVTEEFSTAGFVPADGLTSNPDQLHFNAQSLREFGVRYYRAFQKLENKNRVFPEKPCEDDAVRTGLEWM